MSRVSRLTFALLVVFVLSGFAGLVYQSVWSNYLGLTLGHAAYAQTLVLAIFMGGMALGAWLASLYSVRWKRLVLGYAVVELVIGLLGLGFHPLFVAYTGVSQEVVLPGLDSVALARGYQWLTASLLIAPQSILLGATFPLMSAGLIRALPGEQGEVLGGLYFSNSLGAALGALVATFLLLPAVGLPGTVLTAGVLNIVVALGAWLLAKGLREEALAPLPAPERIVPTGEGVRDGAAASGDVRRLGRVMVWSTAASGAASFIYEVGWIRLLNQALGTTIHSFELMLAAFILGLAFGGLWIRKRAKHIVAPVRYVGYVQVWMGVAALLSVPVFTQSFHWVGWIMGALSRTGSGYTLYELATAAISLLVMFPAAFLAGMTLPLFTLALLRAGAGERSIGRIYAANTVGAIAGVALAMHVLIPTIGVRLAVTAGALLDGLIGLYLLRVVDPARLARPVVAIAVALVAATGFSVLLGRPDPVQQVSGVFRTGKVDTSSYEVEYLRDGKTATVAVFSSGEMRTVSTNGKPDASLAALGLEPSNDEITMIMAGMLPLALHPAPDRIAVIGWGSGLTTHTLLGSPLPKAVDSIEIERAMVDGARLYGERVARAYEDPRSRVHIDDARTFFSTGARRYDAIVSEPSNPWVSGVASLFTREFYAFLKRHLEDDGMLVQWLHTYEIDDPLVGTMLAALLEEFPHADLYLTNSVDLLIVARKSASALMDPRMAEPGSALEAELRRVGLDRAGHFQLRRIGGVEVLRNFVRMTGARPHSDYFPTVSLQAPRTRFMQSSSDFLMQLVTNGLPVLDVLDCRRPVDADAGLGHIGASTFSYWQQAAIAVQQAAVRGEAGAELARGAPRAFEPMQTLLAVSRQLPDDPALLHRWSEGAAMLARGTLGHLPPAEAVAVWRTPAWLPAETMAIPEVAAVMTAFEAAARRDPAAMRAGAERVLALPAERLSPRLREQMLVLAMLGALGTGDGPAAGALEQRWGGGVGSAEWAKVRAYLLAWADGPAPACMARQ